MIKLAMTKIHETFKKHQFKSKMILQVHDELIFDATIERGRNNQPIILECMRSALPLPNEVPVEAEIGGGENWLVAHKQGHYQGSAGMRPGQVARIGADSA